MSKTYYRKPDGTSTTSIDAYLRAWRALAAPAARALSTPDEAWFCSGFDPGFAFHRKDGRGNGLDLDLHVVKLLAELSRWRESDPIQAKERGHERQ